MSGLSTLQNKQPNIGLALGGGSARGWAHIGVIRVLEEMGIKPGIVCGSSIGALVGAAYAGNSLDKLEDWVLTLDWQKTAKFLDIRFHGGLIEGKKLFDFFNTQVTDVPIEELPITFAAVATNLETGTEVWIKEGSVMNAVRASIAIPGLFTPVYMNEQWLVDGGLVNPIPVSLCRALGADTVIAVDLISNQSGRQLTKSKNNHTINSPFTNKLRNLWSNMTTNNSNDNKPAPPSLFDTIASAVNIVQIQLTRSNLSVNPPDISISPHLQNIGLLEFYRARDAISEGRKAMKLHTAELKSIALNLD
ncbi:MAG: patatin [Gammaproteobacteria bacterium]|nr:patatin [Gammaproteobacteria bacterium]